MAAPTPQPTRQTISLTNPMGIPNLPLPPRRPGPPRPPAPPQPMTPFPSGSEALRNIRQQEINDAYQQTLRIYQQASRNWTPNQPTSTINTRSSELFPPLPPPAIPTTVPPRVNAARTRGNTSTNRPSNIPNIRRRQPNTRNKSSRRKKNRKTRRAH